MKHNPYNIGDRVQVSDSWIKANESAITSQETRELVNTPGVITEVSDNMVYIKWDYGDEEWFSSFYIKLSRDGKLNII